MLGPVGAWPGLGSGLLGGFQSDPEDRTLRLRALEQVCLELIQQADTLDLLRAQRTENSIRVTRPAEAVDVDGWGRPLPTARDKQRPALLEHLEHRHAARAGNFRDWLADLGKNSNADGVDEPRSHHPVSSS